MEEDIVAGDFAVEDSMAEGFVSMGFGVEDLVA
jgi:hypothetical protein